MFKFANMNFIYHRYPFEYFLDSTARVGLQDIEIWAGDPHLYVGDVTSWEVTSILRKIKRRDLKVVCFTPEQCMYPINLAAKDDKARRRSVEYFKKSIQVSNSLECSKMVITPGYGFFNESKEEAWKRVRESICEIAVESERAGVALALESFFYPYSNVITDLNELKRMISEVGSTHVKALLDIPIMIKTGNTMEQYATELTDEIIHIHFTDGDGETTAHLAWGKGNLPLQTFYDQLRKMNYDGYLSLELFGTSYNAEPEKAIRQSLEYLATSAK